MSKAVLSRFLVDRIHKGWIDRLFPQGWEKERDPHPTDINNNIISKAHFSTAQPKIKNFLPHTKILENVSS